MMWIENAILPANGSFRSEPTWIPASGPPPSSWWTAGGASGIISAFQPIGAASYTASKSNLANPGTGDATDIIAPSWNATDGWVFNGITQVLNSNVVPGAGQSFIARYSGYVRTNDTWIIGHYLGGNIRAGFCANNSLAWNFSGATEVNTTATCNTSGNVCVVTETQGYVDGVATGFSPGMFSGPASMPMYMGARDREDAAGVPDSFAQVNMQACAFYNSLLTAPQVAAVAAAMAAL